MWALHNFAHRDTVKSVERAPARRVVRIVAADLTSAGFEPIKQTFATRRGHLVTPFIHLHKFSYLPGFRIQIGIRVMNDPFAAIEAGSHAGSDA